MYWQEDPITAPPTVFDVLFDISCKKIPVDHAYTLAQAIQAQLPWIANAPEIGIHNIHLAGSQNGWERPLHDQQNYLILSQRTKLTIRAPHHLVGAIQSLTGTQLLIGTELLKIGPNKIKPLSTHTTIFARHIDTTEFTQETQFLAWTVNEFAKRKINIRKLICGKQLTISTPNGPIPTRSLLLAELQTQDAITIQQTGLGPHRNLGCGIFIPHKGIRAVKQMDN
ncbi:hypothetical protein TI04_04045 [Achromatium sp. WMS2]|nr:hypothetical protein TI04_04045 [Achromatium sp. WMS2]